ncbi:erythromycin esterase family protein [Amycolatopsis lurida]
MPLPESVRPLPLTGIASLVGDAKVVAIGENNHYIREFGQVRAQLLRSLVTELGFSVLAYESGFAEGELADEWIHGAPGEPDVVARNGFTFRFGEPAEVRAMLGWLREHNAGGGRVRFAGLDLPGAGGSALPALAKVRDHLARRASTDLVDAAIEATAPYQSANNSVAFARYSELDDAERDAATAALARLLLQLDAMPDKDPEHLVARHHALGALRLDEHLREFVVLGTAQAPAKVVSSRDVYHAETVRLLRELHGPEARIVLMMHNAHIQRVPMELLPGIRADSAGTPSPDRTTWRSVSPRPAAPPPTPNSTTRRPRASTSSGDRPDRPPRTASRPRSPGRSRCCWTSARPEARPGAQTSPGGSGMSPPIWR